MSQAAQEFIRDWVANNVAKDERPEGRISSMLLDAEAQGFTQGQLMEAVGGNLTAAMQKAMADAHGS